MQMHRFARAGGGWLAVGLIGLLAAIGALISEPAATPISGVATVVDGDTLRLDGERVRLLNIDAPELDQTCQDVQGADWGCGRSARAALQALIAGRHVSCAPQGRDRYGRLLAHCRVAGTDIAQAIVGQGLAVAEGGYFGEEAGARTARRGIWAGDFITPAQWRRQHGEGSGETGLIDLIGNWLH